MNPLQALHTLQEVLASGLLEPVPRGTVRVLVGDFVATITPENSNEWHEHLLTTHKEARLKHALAQHELEAAIQRGEPDRLACAVRAYYSAKDCLYYIGKAWYADLQKRRQPPNSEGP